MVGYHTLLAVVHNAIFLLLTGYYDFYGFEQICLGYRLTAILNRQNGSLVDHIRKIGTNRAGSCQSNRIQIYGIIHMHILGMYLQNRKTPLQIRLVYNNPAIQTARTQKRRIQYLRTVCRCQDEYTLRGIETIHLRQELIQCLLALIVAAQTRITALTDGVDLIDKYNTGSLLLCLLEQVTHTGCADTDEHLHEIRTRQREERYFRLSGNCLRQQSLTGSWRAYQQCALRQLRADRGVSARIMQEINDLHQRLLGLVLTGHIREGHAGLLLHIHLGSALADAHDTAATAFAHHEIEYGEDHQTGNDHIYQKLHPGGVFLNDASLNLDTAG